MSKVENESKNETASIEVILNRILDDMGNIMNIKSNDIPNIDLYMDQVLSFLDDKLEYTQKDSESDERIFTKTMINNYAKNDLLPPPVKKKYSKNHIMVLIFIYFFKNFLSINDVQTLLDPLTDKYFDGKGDMNLGEIYDEILNMGEERVALLEKDIIDKYISTQKSFDDAPEEDREYLRQFMLISLMSYDIFIKKMFIEELIEDMRSKEDNSKPSKGSKKKSDK